MWEDGLGAYGQAASSSCDCPPTPRPLADSEKLPIQKHRNAEPSKSPEKEDVSALEKKSKKPRKKEKKHREKDREKKKKKERKVRP